MKYRKLTKKEHTRINTQLLSEYKDIDKQLITYILDNTEKRAIDTDSATTFYIVTTHDDESSAQFCRIYEIDHTANHLTVTRECEEI